MATGTPPSTERWSFADSLSEFHTESGRSLLDLVDESPVLLAFLRHFACAFCAQTLDRVAKVRPQLEADCIGPEYFWSAPIAANLSRSIHLRAAFVLSLSARRLDAHHRWNDAQLSGRSVSRFR